MRYISIKNLDYVDLDFRVSCLFKRSFGDVEIDEYSYDDTWDDDYEINNDIDLWSRVGA